MNDDPHTWGDRKPPPNAAADPESQRLYDIYARWSGQLHTWVAAQLGAHIDCEFVPHSWVFKLYSGEAEVSVSRTGIPSLGRPPGERCEVIPLPRPEELPSDDDLDYTFRSLCLAAAKILNINLAKRRLANGLEPKRPRTLPPPDKS